MRDVWVVVAGGSCADAAEAEELRGRLADVLTDERSGTAYSSWSTGSQPGIAVLHLAAEAEHAAASATA